MGFWHTGYMDFHEPTGLDKPWAPARPTFPCSQCDKVFSSLEELRRHRFEAHPLRRPALFICGVELGTHPVRVTKPLTAADVRADDCETVMLNGHALPLHHLPEALADVSADICRIVLSNAGVDSDFTLDVRIASQDDLAGVEAQFERIARGRCLDVGAIESFITATAEFKTAAGYCDGLCEYLYGVLAKERSPGSTLPYQAYEGKFTRAASELGAYQRPLSAVVISLIEFHFNHFRESESFSTGGRLRYVSSRYGAWLEGRCPTTHHHPDPSSVKSSLESLLTDWETEKILDWAARPSQDLTSQLEEIEDALTRDISEYDRAKLHVLLGETYALNGDAACARNHAKQMRNITGLEAWAEGLLKATSEDEDERA